MKPSNALLVYTNPTTNEYRKTLDMVEGTLRNCKIKFRLANRDKLKDAQFRNDDLVIAVGGDGTFLRAAQFIKSGQLLFGVNADVKNKEGFYMKSDKRDFEIKIGRILSGHVNIKKFPRLEAYIDNRKIGALALNEFFVGPKKSYHAAKYVIEINGVKERQKSSGILVTTPAGS